jgi:hypothetical protein
LKRPTNPLSLTDFQFRIGEGKGLVDRPDQPDNPSSFGMCKPIKI